jgi:hypothetical protein
MVYAYFLPGFDEDRAAFATKDRTMIGGRLQIRSWALVAKGHPYVSMAFWKVWIDSAVCASSHGGKVLPGSAACGY